MGWVVQGNPNLPAGQASMAQSAPVVIASDDVLETDFGNDRRLDDIATAVMALAAARGIASDLRATILALPNVVIGSGTVTTVSTVTAVTAVTNPLARNTYDVQAQQNTLFAAAFTANIGRP